MLELKEEVKATTFNEPRILAVLASVQFTHIMDFVIMAPLGPILKKEFGIATHETSLLIAAYALSAGICGFLGSFFIDTLDRKKALVFLYIGFILGNILCAVSVTYNFFLIARVISGMFGGVLGALIFAIIGDAIPYERRARATGIVMSAFSAASVIGIPAGLYLAGKITWQMPFIMLCVISAIVLVLAIIWMPSMKGHILKMEKIQGESMGSMVSRKARENMEILSNIMKQSNLVFALALCIMLMLAGMTIVPFLSDFYVNNIGLKQDHISLIYLLGGAATAVTGPLVGKLADKYGKGRVFRIAAIVSIPVVLLVTNLKPLPLPTVYLISTIFFIIFGARFVPAMSMITSSVVPQQRGGFMSINSCVQNLASFAATYGAGLIIANTSSGALVNFEMVGILAVIATLLCVFLSFRVKPVS